MPDFNPQVSLYRNVNALNEPIGRVPFVDVINDIKNGAYREIVESLQNLPEKEYKERKKSLPAATFSGTFLPTTIEEGKNRGKLSYRSEKGLDQYSGIILYDIDKLSPEDLQRYSDQLRNNPYVLAFFRSPSRKGLKILFHDITGDFQKAWNAVNNHLRSAYKLPIDESGKDICRLCFVSDDDQAYYNAQHEPITESFTAMHAAEAKPKKTREAAPAAPAQAGDQPECDLSERLDFSHRTVEKTAGQPGPGNHNKYCGQFAQQANRWGVTLAECIAELQDRCPNYDDVDLVKTVTHHYEKPASIADHGRYLLNDKRKRQRPDAQSPVAGQPGKTATTSGNYDDTVPFWNTVPKTDKKGNKVGDVYSLSFDDTITFLENNGFYKYQLRGDNYHFIRLYRSDNIVDVVNELRIKEFMLGYLKTASSNEFKDIREQFRRSKSICAIHNLEGLEYYRPKLRRDTATKASLYFNNCYLEITAEGIQQMPYNTLAGQCLWKKHVRDFDFKPTDFEGCDAAEFLQRALTGKKLPFDQLSEIDQKKVLSGKTTIGYLLHAYKDPGLAKAVVAVDGVLRRGKENEGRTGKSLLAKMIERVINVVTLDGRNFSLDKAFALQKIDPDTRMVNLNDAKKNLDFTRFFGMITEDLDYEKKNQDILTMSYNDSPKWYISMNSSLRAEGSSARDRQHVIEFTDYYSDVNKPNKEFGRLFFNDWDEHEWQRFYNFMAHCLSTYLAHGLTDFPYENYSMNKLIDRAGEEFVDFMDDNVLSKLDDIREFKKDELYTDFVKDINEKFRPTPREFMLRIKMWAEASNLLINPHTNGERDRRNNITYLTFVRTAEVTSGIVVNAGDPDGDLPF